MLTILFFLSLFSSPSSELENYVIQPVPTVVMESNLMITEIMYNPGGADSDWEWIEIYNNSSIPIDLSGYVLDDNSATQLGASNIASGILEPNQSAVLFDVAGVTAEQFQDVWGNVNLIPVTNWSALGNSAGDSIGIWDSFESYDDDNQTQANTVDKVVYKNGEDFWPPDDGKSSIFLIALDFDNSLGGNWSLSSVHPENVESPLFDSYISTRGDIGSPGTMDLEDMIPPTIECPEMVETNHDEGLCSSEVPLLVPSATDNVSNEFTFNATRSDGLELEAPFPVGDTMITWTATDEADNTSLPCNQLVRVVEIELPTAIAQNITIELDETGSATILPEDLDNLETPSFDNCGIDKYLTSRTEFGCSDLNAPVPVEFSVLDANGNISATTNAEVTVIDRLKPTMACNADILTISSNGNPIMLEDVVEPLVSDNCDTAPVITFSRSDGQELNAPFEVGTTTISWQAVDASGNIDVCAQTIVVDFIASMDNDIVSFSIPEQIGETIIDATEKTIELLMPIGTDVTELSPVLEVSGNAFSNPASGEPRDFTEPLGYIVTAQDGSEQEWTVTVRVEEDTIPPTFEVKGNTEDFITELEVGETYMVGEIINVVDENVTVSEILGDHEVDTSEAGGPFLVSYNVSDGTNTTTIIETVIVLIPNQEILSITDFVLVNADTNEDIFLLEDNMEINLKSLPTLNLNIRANATEDVRSVKLRLSGSDSSMRTENVVPFALFGDAPAGEYFGRIFDQGHYTIEAIGYSEMNAEGISGVSGTINFSIVDLCGGFELNIVDMANPSSCFGDDGFVELAYSGIVGPVTFSWSHDETIVVGNVTNLSEGSYKVMATDSNDCTAEISFELYDPDLPEVTLSAFEPIFTDQQPFKLAGGSPQGGIYSGENVTEGQFDPSVGEGTYEIKYTYVDAITGCENSAMQILTVLLPRLKTQSFTLVNAENNQDILELTEGIQIDMSTLPTLNLNIRANTTEDVQSVAISIDGTQRFSRTENFVPYALYGDAPTGNYFKNEFEIGTYTITATPFSSNELKGEKGTSLSLTFELYDFELSQKSSSHMNVYPNPAVVKTTLSFEEPKNLIKVDVYDVLGRLVGSYKGISIENNGTYVLDVISIPAGTYYIKSYDNKGNHYQRQMIVKK